MLRLDKVGTDCELFLKDKASGKFVPVIGLLGGTKDSPLEVLGGNGFAVQEDNVMVEFNLPPAENATSFVENLFTMKGYLQGWAAQRSLDIGVFASAIFDKSQLDSEQAQRFGCEPDFNVYTRKKNPKPIVPSDMEGLRTAGGHIHVSFTKLDPKDWKTPLEIEIPDREKVIRAMDLFLGVPSLLLDEDKDRRKLYGKAGAFRLKDYGVEYRVLSNFWMKSAALADWVFQSTKYCVENAYELERGMKKDETAIQNAINEGDEKAIDYLLGRWSFNWPTGFEPKRPSKKTTVRLSSGRTVTLEAPLYSAAPLNETILADDPFDNPDDQSEEEEDHDEDEHEAE